MNIDLEILLESNDLMKYEYDELQEKIKEAYDEVFKEGILFGIIVGKIIKLNNCLEDKEKYNVYIDRNYDYYTEYNFKIDFFKKTIPPIKIRKSIRIYQIPQVFMLAYANLLVSITSLICYIREILAVQSYPLRRNPYEKRIIRHLCPCADRNTADRLRLQQQRQEA